MTTNLAEWASEHVQITKIGLSERCGGKIVPEIVKIGYCRGGFENYLGNSGSYLLGGLNGSRCLEHKTRCNIFDLE